MGLVRPLIDTSKLCMINVYIREAHPEDGWSLSSNTSGETVEAATGIKKTVCYMQTHQIAERLQVASDFVAAMGPVLQGIPLVVDDPSTNAIDVAFEAPPERMVVVDDQNKVVFASGQGPFQYSINRLAAFLQAQTNL